MQRIRENARAEGYKEGHRMGVGVQGNRRGTGCGRINRTENYENAIRNLLFYAN